MFDVDILLFVICYLLSRTPEELKTQANVSAPLPVKPSEEKPYIRKLQKIEEPPKEAVVAKKEEPTTNIPQEMHVDDVEESKKRMPDIPKKDNKASNLIKTVKQEKRKQMDKSPVKANKKSIVNEKESDVDFVFVSLHNLSRKYNLI